MTIYSQVKQTIASLKNIEASLESFSNITQQEEAKNVFMKNAHIAHGLVENLQTRMKDLEMEEPQYKGL
jgi:hypothetical protein